MKRVFLDWTQPVLVSAVDRLIGQFSTTTSVDMSSEVLVVPGSRASRRLLELLVDAADAKGLLLEPPEIITTGSLLERMLLLDESRIADDWAEVIAWSNACQRRSDLSSVVLRSLPQDDDGPAWFAFAEIIRRLYRELSADRASFSQAAVACAELDRPDEAERWSAFAEIESEYHRELEGLGLVDRQLSREDALRARHVDDSVSLHLIACVDLNAQAIALLELATDVTHVLIYAPSQLEKRFDDFGRLVSETWQHAAVDYKLDEVCVTDKPEDQAVASVVALDSFAGRFAADQITIGTPDPQVSTPLGERLDRCNIAHHEAGGRPLRLSLPFRLLTAVRDYIDGRQYEDFAGLVRHPDVEAWLTRARFELPADHPMAKVLSGDWFALLDRVGKRRIPSSTDDPYLRDPGESGAVAWILEACDAWLSPLTSERLRLHDWGPRLRRVLATIYDVDVTDKDPQAHALAQALEVFGKAINALSQLDASNAPPVDASQAIQLLTSRLANAAVPERSEADAIDLVGWLELLHDDAPAVIITGMNEGRVPQSVTSDPFLPDTLRRRLGLLANDRRYARDAYLFMSLVGSRQALRVVLGRRTSEGDPLVPSRILFAGSSQLLPERVRRLMTTESTTFTEAPGEILAGREELDFPVPMPTELSLEAPIDSLSVTAFRDYLECPYGFYLKHVCKLRTLGSSPDELDALAFGNLAHHVLDAFGNCTAAGSSDFKTIREALHDLLDDRVLTDYGPQPKPAVLIQVEQMRLRLDSFARWQADWTKAGWTIEHTELQIAQEDQASLTVDGEKMGLVGRIDRIDVNRITNERIIFDYKTSEAGKDPKKTHQKKDEWIDLQLPLYRHLVRAAGITGDVQLGYIVLPKKLSDVGERLATWSVDDLCEADEVAADVVRSIRKRLFSKRTLPVPIFFKDFAAIYQEGTLTASATSSSTEEESKHESS